jgi:hypothetical protein
MCSDKWSYQKQFPLRLQSSGIWCTLVWWEFTNFSEESATTITLKMEKNLSSETIVYSCQIYRVTSEQTVIFTAYAARISAIEMPVLYAVICIHWTPRVTGTVIFQKTFLWSGGTDGFSDDVWLLSFVELVVNSAEEVPSCETDIPTFRDNHKIPFLWKRKFNMLSQTNRLSSLCFF